MDDLFDRHPAEWASYAAGLAMIKWHAGEKERARELMMLHAANGFARVGEDGEHLTTLFMFGRVAIGAAELDAAAALYELLLPHAGLWAVDGIAACCWGPVELELARIALGLGRVSEARAHVARALLSLERAQAPRLMQDAVELSARCEAGREPLPSPDEAAGANSFRRHGQFWTIVFRGFRVRMNDAKGLRDLARLLARPGDEIHALDLVAARDEPTRAALARAGDHGELLDARARAEYRRRLAELDDELADAERCSDLGRIERARYEHDFLTAELSAALGIGGRPRRSGDAADRARKAVTARIRLTIGRIANEHPDLARHLEHSIRTGTFCVYRPEAPTAWQVEQVDLASPHAM